MAKLDNDSTLMKVQESEKSKTVKKTTQNKKGPSDRYATTFTNEEIQKNRDPRLKN